MFGGILGDLSEAGFDAEWCVLGADDVGAPHRRKRLWILAYREGLPQRPGLREGEPAGEWRGRLGDGDSPWAVDPADVGYADEPGPQGHGREHELSAAGGQKPVVWTSGSGEVDPWLALAPVGRVATGIPARVDRLRGLGNAQCPQTMVAAFTLLAREAGVSQ
jgi:DNA (cytosine-5)-methyltransferase 1